MHGKTEREREGKREKQREREREEKKGREEIMTDRQGERERGGGERE